MSFIKNIKIELIFFIIIAFSIFLPINIDNEIHQFFLTISNSFSNIYLKDFFVKITELGNSIWYFGISILLLLFFYTTKRVNLIKIEKLENKINFFISSIVYLISIGLITQILKHIFGRARPNHFDFTGGDNFDFFTFESNFHSFPSGHSSTIFMVFFILVGILPKLKHFFLILTFIVAISRVVVGAHFLSDVIAGALLSLIVYKSLNRLFYLYDEKYIIKEVVLKKNTELIYSFIILSTLAIFLSVSPSGDLYVASLFYYGDSQFLLQAYNILSIIFRKILLPIIIIYILFFPILGKFINIEKIYFGYKFSYNEIVLIWFSQISVILIFVNLVLKNMWGRSRPGDITEFGGTDVFTPWYKLGKLCDTNCSFVSGDSSVGFAIIVLYFITKKNLYLYLSFLLGSTLGLIRILAGGHFLSDVVFSGIFVILLNLIIIQIYKRYYEQ